MVTAAPLIPVISTSLDPSVTQLLTDLLVFSTDPFFASALPPRPERSTGG